MKLRGRLLNDEAKRTSIFLNIWLVDEDDVDPFIFCHIHDINSRTPSDEIYVFIQVQQ